VSQFDHWMRFHVGDYLADTMHLSTFQHGIYVLLIMHYFKHGSLPETEGELARIAKVTALHWRQASPPVLALFRVSESGARRHTRIDAERAHAREVSEARSFAGKQGGRPGGKKANASENKANAFTTHARARPEPDPIAKASPPYAPLKGGRRARGHVIGAEKASRNGFADSATSDMQETNDHAQASDPPARGAAVVPIARHLVRRQH
jgi:uncharacterized protein YdaU (DUF1376 family)